MCTQTHARRISFLMNSGDLSTGRYDVERLNTLLLNPNVGACDRDNGCSPHYDCQKYADFHDKLKALLVRWEPEDQLIYYYSGHGKVINGMYCLQFGPTEEDFEPFENILNLLLLKSVTRAILIIDACFSGAAGDALMKGDPEINSFIEEVTEKTLLPNGIVLLSSSGPRQYSEERPGHFSIFTGLLCEALEEGLGFPTHDNMICVEDIVEFVNNRLETNAELKQHIQRAHIWCRAVDRKIWLAPNKTREKENVDVSLHSQTEQSETISAIYFDSTPDRLRPVTGTDAKEIDWSVVREYARVHPNIEVDNLQGTDLLSELGLLSAWPPGNRSLLHKSAVLAFCQQPQKYFSGAKSHLVVETSPGERLDRDTFYGPVSKQITELIKKTFSNLRKTETIREDGKRDYEYEIPTDLVREMISNALCHRNYDSLQPTRVVLTEKWLEISSPGPFPGGLSPQLLLEDDTPRSHPTDPQLTEYLQNLLVFEEAGNGFRNARAFMSIRGREALSIHVNEGSLVVVRIKRHTKEADKVDWRPDHSGLDVEIESYYAKVGALHANLPVAGFVTQFKIPIDIEDIYVPLNATLDLSMVDEGISYDAAQSENALSNRGKTAIIPLPEAFQHAETRRQKGIIILGQPGSGKTTHLKRLLLWCLRKGSSTLGLPEDMLPVYLPLRDLQNLDQGLDTFIQKQLANPHLNTKSGFGKRLLNRGNLLFLLDGLDEVADHSQREMVSRWIVDALRYHPTCRFVVTCRFAGYSSATHLNEDFLETSIRSLTTKQVEQFVHKWYRVVERGMAEDFELADGIAAEKATDLVKRFNASDFRARNVFELTRNPLLLTNICLVHRHRGGLPQKRARLYEECIDVLLEHWRLAKGLKVGVSAQEGRRVLQPTALWLHGKKGRTKATAEEIAPHIQPVLNSGEWQGGSVDNFLRTIRDQSGLLTGWDQENYGFMHLGFQEYLAAREIRSRAFKDPSVLQDLAEHFGESWWQEVTLLLLALEDPSLFDPFMQKVVSLQAFVEHLNLVEACFDDSSEKSFSPFVELLKRAPRNDKKLWDRQFACLKLLERLAFKVVEELGEKLARHPFPDIRRWIQSRLRQEEQENIEAEKGGYQLVRIPGGEFMMGSPEAEEGRATDEGPVHKVNVPDYYIGRYPVTNKEYGLYLKENIDVPEPSYWTDPRYNLPNHPVVGVSWDCAKRYAKWAGLRLPTEAEWEYACRAGTSTPFFSGKTESDLERVGWFLDNAGQIPHSVGEKEPNSFGLYDMHGNVWEVVEDDWHESYKGAPDGGQAWIDRTRGSKRVMRGGAYYNQVEGCRSAFRQAVAESEVGNTMSFRLSMSVSLDSERKVEGQVLE